MNTIVAATHWQPLLQVPSTSLGTIVNSFDHAFSFDRAGQLYTVVAVHKSVAPYTLVSEHEVFPRLEPGTNVSTTGEGIQAGPVHIQLADRKIDWYDCRIPASALNPRMIAKPTLAELTRYLHQHGTKGTFIARAQPVGIERALHEMLDSASTTFEAAIRARDKYAAANASTKLVGLGMGLTPSGDDYLIGALAVLTAASAEPTIAAIKESISKEVSTRMGETTEVSRQFLAAALAGEFSRTIKDVLGTISLDRNDRPSPGLGNDQVWNKNSRSTTVVLRAAANLLAVGSTSGTDTLAGIIACARGLA